MRILMTSEYITRDLLSPQCRTRGPLVAGPCVLSGEQVSELTMRFSVEI